jgi:hypothetical protein
MFLVQDIETGELGAGMRLDVVDPTHPIPLEEALKNISPDIVPRVHKYNHVLAEGCGWWVRKDFSERNLPKYLLRAGIAIAPKLRIHTIVGFPHQHTIGIMQNLGFTIVETIGDNGSFTYPDPRYKSTIVELDDTIALSTMSETERQIIFSLRQNPVQTFLETYRGEHQVEIECDLRLW